VQIARGLENLEQLRNRLKGRAEIDSVRSQVLRAEAAIAKQQAAMANAKAQIRSSDAILRSLVASPELRSSPEQLVPVSTVVSSLPQLDATNERTSALEHQPRVLEIQEEIKAARAKLQVAQHELQPTLNLVLQGYLRGLSGDYDVGNSLEDQFSSTPSYHAGIAYQKPKGNLAAQAIAKESRMELRRALLKLDDALLSVSANVETALAGIDSAYQQMDSAVRSTLATQAEVQYLESQWNDAFMASDSRGSLQLDQLLNAHIQLIVAENSWVSSQRDYMLALAKLQLATGKLLPAFYCNN
jgi:outer membrane protein TolC